MQFQAIASKANKKLTLSLTANNIEDARAILHGQGYSIMELRENTVWVAPVDIKTNFFYFDIRVNWQIKTGKIQSDDVFKSYKKLVDDLWYDVVYIYTNEWMQEEQKKVITAKVRDSYRMYKQSVGENIDEVKFTKDEMELQEISPEVLRQVEQYGIIIDSTIEDIQNLILKYHNILSLDRKSELEDIMRTLVQTKWSSNIWKIKLVVENSLKTVGEIKLDLVKTGKEEEKKKFLQETNALLKQIGSNDRIEVTQKNDIWKSITDALSRFSKKEEKKESKKVDTNSFIFYKNQRELAIYKEIHSKNDRQILKSAIMFQWKNLKRLWLKRKLLQQNIQIIDNRIHNRNISYTKVVKWFRYYVEVFTDSLDYIARIGSYILCLYILFFILLQIWREFWVLSFAYQENKSILYITLFSSLALIFSFTRSLWAFFFSLPVIYVVFMFLSINF